MSTGPQATTAVVVEKAYALALWLLPKVEKFPRSYRFNVGDRMVGLGLEAVLLLVDAAYSAEKGEFLTAANRKVNGLRYLLRRMADIVL